MNLWAARYIGLPWDKVGDNVSSFNCWTFVQMVQEKHFGRELPDISANAVNNLEVARHCISESSSNRWKEVPDVKDGDCVLMCRSQIPVHVGVWVSGLSRSGVLHCARGLGVTHQRLLDLKASGWGKLTYYRWINHE